MNHGKFERLFSLFNYLTFNRNKTVKDLARLLGTGVKTIYHYIETFRDLGFGLSTVYGTVYSAMKLMQASKEHKVVILHGYESNKRNSICERIVEPFDFCWYFNYLWAYDLEKKQNILFRVTQISEVEILDADLCSYRAVARFYQGHCSEIEILEGEGLEDFAIDQMERQLQLAKAKREKRQQAAAMTA